MSKISVYASMATSTGVEGALDVDVTIDFDGHEVAGAVTLVRNHEGHWAAWGDRDHWVSSNLLKALDALDDDMLADDILRRIERAASESCDQYEG